MALHSLLIRAARRVFPYAGTTQPGLLLNQTSTDAIEAVVLRVAIQVAAVAALPDTVLCEYSCREYSADACKLNSAWPVAADVQYFHSELRMAFEFLEIGRTIPEYAPECVRRALSLYIQLSGWVQSNNCGNGYFEEQLQTLRWRIAAGQRDEESPAE